MSAVETSNLLSMFVQRVRGQVADLLAVWKNESLMPANVRQSVLEGDIITLRRYTITTSHMVRIPVPKPKPSGFTRTQRSHQRNVTAARMAFSRFLPSPPPPPVCEEEGMRV